MEHEGDTICKWSAWNGPPRLLEELEIRGRIETMKTIGSVKIG